MRAIPTGAVAGVRLPRRVRAPRLPAGALWPLAAYAALSVVIYGHTVLASPTHIVEGSFFGRDQSQFVWFLEWAARHLSHPQSVLYTRELFVPTGYDLTWATSILGPAFVMAPVTLAAGPVASYDVLALAAPAVAAWATFLLCRQLTGKQGPSLVAGLLFGFGSYETAESINHVNLALVALLPLAALLVVRRRAGLMSRRAFVAALGAVLALQLWTSSEVLASMVGFGAVAFVIAAVAGGRDAWHDTAVLAAESLAGLVLACLLGALFLYHALRHGNPVGHINATGAQADLANSVIPTDVTLLHGPGRVARIASRLYGNLSEQASYLGIPLLVLVACFGVAARRTLAARFLLPLFLIATLLSLGSTLVVDGHKTGLDLPWGLVDRLPLVRYASPNRLVVYAWLAAAVVVAYWLAQPTRRTARWALAAAAVACVAPNATGAPWGARVDSPALLREPTLARYVPRGSTVLALPFGMYGDSMFWQVESDFEFRLAGGYVSGSLPSGYAAYRHVIRELQGQPIRRPVGGELCSFLRFTRTRVIILRDRTFGSWRALLSGLRVPPVHEGGFSIYELAAPTCPAKRTA